MKLFETQIFVRHSKHRQDQSSLSTARVQQRQHFEEEIRYLFTFSNFWNTCTLKIPFT